MGNISKPDVNISVVSANTVLDIGTRKDLIICQTPGATANTLVTGIQDFTQTALDSLLGTGSYCRVMVQEWLDANQTGNNVKAALDVITLAEDGGAAAAATVLTFSGTATEAGTITLSLLSSKLYKKEIGIASGDTHIVTGTAVVTAFTGVVAPFTVADSGPADGIVTITASDAGTIGNDYGIEISGIPAGLTAVITAATGGATPPSVIDVMDLVGSVRYQGVLWPTDLATSIETELGDFLDARFNTSNDILDGVGFMGESNTLAGAKVVVNALNSQSLVVMGNALAAVATTPAKDGPELMHPADWTVAEFMAIRARRLSDNSLISSVVITNAFNDQFGGRSLASLPYFNTPLEGTPVTNSIGTFDGSEQAELNVAGFSVVGPNRPLTETITGAIVTTYKTDEGGNPDASFKYLEYVDTSSVCKEFLFNNLKSLFSQSRLTDGDLVEGRSMQNAASIKAAFKRLLSVLKDDALIRKGRAADKLVEDTLTVVLDLAGRKASINSVLPIVTQLEIVNTVLQLSFEL